MKKFARIFGILIISLCFVLSLTCCGEDKPINPNDKSGDLTGPVDLCVGERFELVFPEGVEKTEYNISCIYLYVKRFYIYLCRKFLAEFLFFDLYVSN